MNTNNYNSYQHSNNNNNYNTNSKSRILSKLLIGQKQMNTRGKDKYGENAQNNNIHSNFQKNTNNNGKYSKSRSLYNVKDFLPTQQTNYTLTNNNNNNINNINMNMNTMSNTNLLTSFINLKRNQTQPMFIQTQKQKQRQKQKQIFSNNNSKIFFLKSVTDGGTISQQSYLKQKALQNQSFIQDLKRKDFKIEDLEAQIRKITFDKNESQKRCQKVEQQKQILQTEYLTTKIELQKTLKMIKQYKQQLEQIKKRQDKKKRQIKFWSQKIDISIVPNKQLFSIKQSYSISCQTQKVNINSYNNYLSFDFNNNQNHNNKRSILSLNSNLNNRGFLNQNQYQNISPYTPVGTFYNNSQKVSHQTSQINFYNGINRMKQNQDQNHTFRNRRASDYQINQKRGYNNLHSDRNLQLNNNNNNNNRFNLNFVPFNKDKQNQGINANFNLCLGLPLWQKQTQLIQKQKNSLKNKIKQQSIQIYPIDQKDAMSIIKQLLE